MFIRAKFRKMQLVKKVRFIIIIIIKPLVKLDFKQNLFSDLWILLLDYNRNWEKTYCSQMIKDMV